MEVIAVPIDQLVFDPANARKHSEKNLAAIKGSLAKFGQQKPIVIDKNNVVVAGNGTLAAAKALGWTDISAVKTDLEGTAAVAFAVADNRSAELAEWDSDVLSKTLAGLRAEDFDLEGIGFDDGDLSQWLKEAEKAPPGCDEDEVPQHVEPKTRLGDLYQLGEHRLLCGDSTDVLQVERLMNGAKADMVFTDPPYGCSLSKTLLSNSSEYRPIENDDLSDGDLLDFFRAIVSNYYTVLRDWGVVYWFFSSNKVVPTRQAVCDVFKIKDTIVWVKESLVLGRNDYQPKYEPLLYLEKVGTGKVLRTWNGERNKTNVWEISRDKSIKEHPTQKPVAVIEFAIANSSNTKDLVIDLFLGSGSTLIACEKTGRKCYGMEIDPHYCDVIVARWEKFTGKTAKLVARQDQ